MKPLGTFFGLLILSLELNAQIISPKFAMADVPQCEIMQLGVTDSTTNIFFKFTGDIGGSICVNDDYYLRDTKTDKKYKLINSVNIPICPSAHLFDSLIHTHHYALTFEPLARETKEIDIIESQDKNGFNFYGVSLENNDSQMSSELDYIDLLENSPVREIGYFLKDDRTVQYTAYKGLAVAMHLSIEKAYGKYFVAYISIENNSGKRVDFYPELIKAYILQGDKEIECEALTYNEYTKKVKNQQAWNSLLCRSWRIIFCKSSRTLYDSN